MDENVLVASEYSIASSSLIPFSHGFQLFSALSRAFPFLHGKPGSQIAPLRGRFAQPGWMTLDPKSKLHLRGLSPEQEQALSGTLLYMGGTALQLGECQHRILKPSSRLVSRLVIYHNPKLTERKFLKLLLDQIQKRNEGKLESFTAMLGKKRFLSFKAMNLMGWGVELNGLSEKSSLMLQAQGLGSHNSMGCGVFYAPPCFSK